MDIDYDYLAEISLKIQSQCQKIAECFYGIGTNLKELTSYQSTTTDSPTKEETNLEELKKKPESEEQEEPPKRHKKSYNDSLFCRINGITCIDNRTKRKIKGFRLNFFVYGKTYALGPYKHFEYVKNLKSEIMDYLVKLSPRRKTEPEIMHNFLNGVITNLYAKIPPLKLVN